MPSTTPRAVVLAAVLLLAGCLGGPGADASNPTTTDDARQLAHEVRVENDLNVTRSVAVTITQSGEVVDEGSYEVAPGTDVVAYGWEAETVPGNDTFVVRMQPDRGEVQEVTFTVDDCHGDVVGYFTDEGLEVTYSVC